MKKVFSLLAVLALVVSMAVSPVFAEGGKVRGEDGKGTTNQAEDRGDGADEAPDNVPDFIGD